MKYEYTFKHAKLVNKILITLLLLTILFSYIGVVQSGYNVTPTSNKEFANALKKNKIILVVGLTANKEFILLNSKGQQGNRCSFNFKSKLPRCKGADKLISVKSITLIESQGSHCYATTDESLKATQVCLDPIFH